MNLKIIRKSFFRIGGMIFFFFLLSCSQNEVQPFSPVSQTAGGGGGLIAYSSSFRLQANLAGQGGGTVTSSPAGIGCGSSCFFIYSGGSSVTLTAVPAGGSTFVRWSGDCAGTGACTLTMNSNKNVTALFNVNAASLNVSEVEGGQNHTCALKSDGSVKCWGKNGSGQLGNQSFSDSLIPVQVFGITSSSSTTAIAISTGGDHSCVVMHNGTINCWGSNSFGQLGNNSSSSSFAAPVPVFRMTSSSSTTATAVSAGGNHTCSLMSDGSVFCWGLNNSGQLGNNSSSSSFAAPVLVFGMTSSSSPTAAALSAGADHTCALMFDGTVRCWGSNTSGQLGNGSSFGSFNYPVVVTGITRAVAISAGGDHTCAVISDGTVNCWGSNTFGQLGNGQGGAVYSSPVSVTGLTPNAISVAAGANHTCALLSDGTVDCWGLNSLDQLGNGTISFSQTPTLVTGISKAVVLGAGDNHTCVILSDGTVQCWGSNSSGQLGYLTNIPFSFTPQSVSSL